MLRNVSILFCLVSAVLSHPANAATASNAPVAFVYLASSTNMNPEHVLGYAASADGQLTPIPGSPFYALVGSLAVNGKYLFGSSMPGGTSQSPANIYSYLIEPNGALKYVGATNTRAGSTNRCNTPSNLLFDHTGSDLYVYASFVGCMLNPENAYQSFSLNKYTGQLQDLYTSIPSASVTAPLVLSTNDKFAYSLEGTGYLAYGRTPHAYQRQSGGELMDIAIDLPEPGGNPPDFAGLFQAGAATDASEHLAVYEIYFLAHSGQQPSRLAIYTINPNNGALSTNSTYTNMPAPLVGNNVSMRFSPGGNLLAVGGSGGLQIFSANGDAQARPITGLLTTDAISQIYWDNANHLYALGANNGLHIYTVTAAGAEQAPGSPYNVGSATSLIVQPK